MGGIRWHHAVVVLAAGAMPACNCTEHSASADAADIDADDGPDANGGADAAPDAIVPDAEPPLAQVKINEIVLFPHHDWSDEAGAPYDAVPGANLPESVRDQFVELRNDGNTTLDLTGWTLEMIDPVGAVTDLDAHDDVVFEAGSTVTAFAPGALLVIGDPVDRGSTDVYVVLRDQYGRVVDDVEVGGLSIARDMEGDGPGDGAPDPGANGYAKGSFSEAVGRPIGAPDTDDDQDDFIHLWASPLAPNLVDPPPVESIAPQVVGYSTGTTFRISAAIRVELDEIIDPFSVDAALSVEVGGAPVALGFATFDLDDHVIEINPVGVLPFDADIDVTVRGGAGGVRDLAGNPLAADLTFSVHTEDAPANPADVRLNEICGQPQQDWSDDEGGDGLPYSATPGTGTIDSDDEWIEIVNLRPGATDMSGYSVVLYRGTNLIDDPAALTPLDTLNSVVQVIGTGTGVADVRQNDRIVIGDPGGALPPDFWLELRDDSGVLIDTVEVGGNSAGTDHGGDGIDDGAPGPGQDATGADLSSECVARLPDLADTGDEADDFAHTAATPGTAN